MQLRLETVHRNHHPVTRGHQDLGIKPQHQQGGGYVHVSDCEGASCPPHMRSVGERGGARDEEEGWGQGRKEKGKGQWGQAALTRLECGG